jgi:hypothetical protein
MQGSKEERAMSCEVSSSFRMSRERASYTRLEKGRYGLTVPAPSEYEHMSIYAKMDNGGKIKVG